MARYTIREKKQPPGQAFEILRELFREYSVADESQHIDLFENDSILFNLIDDRLYASSDRQLIRIGIKEGVHKVARTRSRFFYRRQLSKHIDVFCNQYGIKEKKAISIISGIYYAAGGCTISAKKNQFQIMRVLSFFSMGIITFSILCLLKVLYGFNSTAFQYTYIGFALALFIKDMVYMIKNKDIRSCSIIITGKDNKGNPSRIYMQSIILCACLLIIMIIRVFWGV